MFFCQGTRSRRRQRSPDSALESDQAQGSQQPPPVATGRRGNRATRARTQRSLPRFVATPRGGEGDELYDPEHPTDDEQPSAQNFASLIAGLEERLTQKINKSNENFSERIAGHFSHLEKKAKTAEGTPSFKSDFNRKHFNRSMVYKSFLTDARYYVQNNNIEDGIVCINLCLEAIDKYIDQIKIADASVVGWQLVDRVNDPVLTPDLKSLENKILDERKRKNDRDNQGIGQYAKPAFNRSGQPGQAAQPRQPVAGQGYSYKPHLGPCIWCSGAHLYKQCKIWQQDVESGAAVFDRTARKWIRVAEAAGPSQADQQLQQRSSY